MGIQNRQKWQEWGRPWQSVTHPCPSSAGQMDWGYDLAQGWFVPLGETSSICATQTSLGEEKVLGPGRTSKEKQPWTFPVNFLAQHTGGTSGRVNFCAAG